MKIWFRKGMRKKSAILPESPIDVDSAKYAKNLEGERIERASLILDFSKQQYDYALDRTRNVEEKALKVFSSLSIVVTAFVFLIRYISTLFFTAKFDIFYVLTLITGGGTFLLISLAWYNVFRAVHLTDIHTQGYGSKTDDYVFENPRDVSIWGLARRYSEAAAIIDDKHTKKAEYVGLSIKFTGYTALCFVIFVVSCLLMAAIQEANMPKNQQVMGPLPSYRAGVNAPKQNNQVVQSRSMKPERVDAPELKVSLESLDSILRSRIAS